MSSYKNTSTTRMRSKKRNREQIRSTLPSSLPLTKRSRSQHLIKWKSDLNLNDNDKNNLKLIYKQIQDSTHLFCINICQNIAEYSLGILEKCPSCTSGEVLVIQSSFDNDHIPLCNQCNAISYVYKCSQSLCNIKKYFDKSGWWISSQSVQEIQRFPIPTFNVCTTCQCLNVVSHKLDDTLDRIICNKLCQQCIFQCNLCNDIFCKQDHLAYSCNRCDYKYCNQCYYKSSLGVKHSKCINCCVYPLYFKKYPNLQDRFIITESGLSKFINSIIFIIPSNILQFIDEYTNNSETSSILNCHHPGCTSTVYISNGILKHIKKTSLLKCNKGHLNYYHRCAKCEDSFLDNVSFIKYLGYSPFNNNQWFTDWTTAYDRNIIQGNFCITCYDEHHKMQILCNKCKASCTNCNITTCNRHNIKCINCNNCYCYSCTWTDQNIIKDCSLCYGEVCKDCIKYNTICNDCYSPYIDSFCDNQQEYEQCSNISKIIHQAYTPLSFQYHILNIISVYCMDK